MKANLSTQRGPTKGQHPTFVCNVGTFLIEIRSHIETQTNTGEKPYAWRDYGLGFSQNAFIFRHQKKDSAKETQFFMEVSKWLAFSSPSFTSHTNVAHTLHTTSLSRVFTKSCGTLLSLSSVDKLPIKQHLLPIKRDVIWKTNSWSLWKCLHQCTPGCFHPVF